MASGALKTPAKASKMPRADFDALHVWHITKLKTQHSYISDALSGKRLDALQQCIAIDVTSKVESDAVLRVDWLARVCSLRVRWGMEDLTWRSGVPWGVCTGATRCLSLSALRLAP